MAARFVIGVLGLLVVGSLGAFVGAQESGEADDTARPTNMVTFYGHVFGHGLDQPMPANTQAPVGENNYGIGGAEDCTSATPRVDGGPAGNVLGGDCRETTANTLALFSTAGFVDVKDRAEFLQNGDYALLHNERGQTKDVVLDTAQSITASIYLTMDAHGWFVGVVNPYGTNCAYPHPPDVPCLYPSWGWDPGVFPNTVVEATLYAAVLGEHGANASNAPPVVDAIVGGQAEVIAQGRWGPDTVMNGLPGAPNVNQFVIDLGAPQVSRIEREKSFFMVYSVYQEANGVNYMINSPFRFWSGELFPPTFTLPVKNAFDVERVIPNFAHGKLAILGVMNTPWGSYDISPRSVALNVERASAATVALDHLQRFGEFSVAHGGHYLPINITWIWDYNADRAQPGTYTVSVVAQNFQGSAEARCAASFELRENSRGQLAPFNVQEGVCGQQSASDEFIEGIRQGTEAGGS